LRVSSAHSFARTRSLIRVVHALKTIKTKPSKKRLFYCLKFKVETCNKNQNNLNLNNVTNFNKKTKMNKYKQTEFENLPFGHGGKRENAGRKATKTKTIVIRIEERLLPELEKLKKGENQSELKESLLQQIEVIKSHREKAENIEKKRKGEDYGQFEQILLIEAELNRLKTMIEKI
jgi:hypothetical protein